MVNAGAWDGLLPGMELNVIERNVVQWTKVQRMRAQDAEADFTVDADEPLPQVGWTVSTRPDYR